MSAQHPGRTASVSTHILDTSLGRPARGVAVQLSVRDGAGGGWTAHGASETDTDGRCADFPVLPEGTRQVRLSFETEPYFASNAGGTEEAAATDRRAGAQQDAPRVRDSAPEKRESGGFFPEVTVTFSVMPGEHHHVPLLLNPFGYSVYRGS